MSDQTEYDPVTYWNDRPNPNRAPRGPLSPGSVEWDYIAPHIEDGAKLFELGPGVGRLFGLYRGHQVRTLDLSRRYRDEIAEAARRNDVEVEQFWSSDPLAPFPFADEEVDLAIAVQVLIHVPFRHIKHTIAEMGRISRKAIIISGYDENWPTKEEEAGESNYCFKHDYVGIFDELGFSVIDRLRTDRREFFLFE